uniref:Uncharacterized protein n=1 Tax=Panagrolaimus davidi TaxID=227884 RepID=A0A914QID9_9BILA
MEEAEYQYFTPEEADDTQSSDEEDLIPFDKSICRRFYDTYEAYQEFALPGPIVRYVLENAGHQVLRKLFASCKYFFAKQQTPICYGFRTGQREIYKDESLTLNRHSKKESFPKNIYITGYINCRLNVLPKFYRCEAKFIDIHSCGHLSFDELKSLIGHGGVVKLKIGGCKLKDEKNECVALETIMEFLPNIVDLDLNNVKITEKTTYALTKIKFNSKFESIFIYLISGEPFKAEEFSKFLIVNKSDQYFHCELTFCKKFNADFVQNLEKFMEEGPTSDYDYFKVNVDSDLEESGDEFETDSD